ncbi:MAG: hypothetical protein BRC30_00425 [Nanohaloarchaea archaeon SW_7_46_7]|nr:MAG: hypothetical protein BRC30_00425 [Nanohaloarchaea archaeon SW_7_46_7]
MIADFVEGEDLYVFFEEGDLERLEQGLVKGVVEDSSRPSLNEGDLVFRHVDDMFSSRPGVATYEGAGVSDVEVVIDDSVYNNLVDGEVYEGGVGDYQEIPRDASVRFFPPENRDVHGSEYKALTD